MGEGAASISLGAVLMEERVQARVEVDCGREDGEKHGERQNNQPLTMDGMKME